MLEFLWILSHLNTIFDLLIIERTLPSSKRITEVLVLYGHKYFRKHSPDWGWIKKFETIKKFQDKHFLLVYSLLFSNLFILNILKEALFLDKKRTKSNGRHISKSKSSNSEKIKSGYRGTRHPRDDFHSGCDWHWQY